jgi:dTDP-4-amino-4,6-dideoxygalactose transaminase
MTCGGEGGMVITDDDELAYRSMLLANHGRGSDYRESHNSELIGFNYRLSEILAAIGRVQLRHVDDWNNQRRTNTAIYQELFAKRKLPLTYTIEPTWGYHTRMRTVTLVQQRDALVKYLEEQGIQASPEYKIPVHLNRPYVAKFGFHKGQLPISERIANETMVLPGWPGLTRGEVEYVVDAVERFYNK